MDVREGAAHPAEMLRHPREKVNLMGIAFTAQLAVIYCQKLAVIYLALSNLSSRALADS